MRQHMSKTERRNLIFAVTLNVARTKGLFKFNLDDVAISSNCSKSLVKHHYRGITNLRSLVILYGRENKVKWINETSIMELLN